MMLLTLVLCLQLDPCVKSEVLSALERLSSFCVDFRQETYSEFLEPSLAEGTLCLSRPGRMRMAYSKGDRKLVVCNGQEYVEIDYLAETQTRTMQADIDAEPLVRILLYGDDVDQYYLMDRIKDENGRDLYRFRPRDASPFVVEMALSPHGLPESIHVFSEEGDGSRYTFEEFDLNPTFSAGFFDPPESGFTQE